MRFAIFSSMGNTTWNDVATLWKHTEQTGWDAACVTDHFMPNTPDRVGDMLESWTTLTALAALTKRIRVGTIVSGNTYRHPAVLAKMAANIDIISGGRLICGIGAGWQENEHAAYGIPFYTMGERLKRLDGYCAEIGRDAKTILRSAVMVPVLSEDRAEIDKMQQIFMKRMGRDEASAKDTLLAGSIAQIQDRLGKLRESGVGLLFIPTMFLGKDQLKPLDAFIEKVAPALR